MLMQRYVIAPETISKFSFRSTRSDFKMLAITTNIRREPIAFNAGLLALLFVVGLGFSSEKVEASIISPPVSASSSDTLSYESYQNATEDFGTSDSIVKSLLQSFSRTDDSFGEWVSFDQMKTQTGASNSGQLQAQHQATPQLQVQKTVQPAQQHDLQSIPEVTWIDLVADTAASDGSGCRSTSTADSDGGGRFVDGTTTNILCEIPVQTRLYWLRSRYLMHVPKAHVSELLRPPQVLGALS